MNEERDSQLSAMFDGELQATECELLSRRLGRDEQLRARWSRYAAIGAVLRADPTVVVHGNLARRVSAAVAAESTVAKRGHRALWQTVAGSAWRPRSSLRRRSVR
jgi:negative regulator of sigma E activity